MRDMGLLGDDQPAIIELQSREGMTMANLGQLAFINAAAPAADTAPAQSGAYVQADVQAILTELRALKARLRECGIVGK